MSFTFLGKDIERIIIYYTMVYYTSFHSGDKTGTNIIRYIGRRHTCYTNGCNTSSRVWSRKR